MVSLSDPVWQVSRAADRLAVLGEQLRCVTSLSVARAAVTPTTLHEQEKTIKDGSEHDRCATDNDRRHVG
ncbi:hypothetical protein [Micromonospora sp. NPDC003776]